jgi:hypothetical protein
VQSQPNALGQCTDPVDASAFVKYTQGHKCACNDFGCPGWRSTWTEQRHHQAQFCSIGRDGPCSGVWPIRMWSINKCSAQEHFWAESGAAPTQTGDPDWHRKTVRYSKASKPCLIGCRDCRHSFCSSSRVLEIFTALSDVRYH